jgi:hypothetical protein
MPQLTDDRAVQRLETRFLFPFFLDPMDAAAMAQAANALKLATVAGQKGLWQSVEPADLYCEELLAHVQDYLFPKANAATDHRAVCTFINPQGCNAVMV